MTNPINPRHLHDLISNDILRLAKVLVVSSLSLHKGPVDTTDVTHLKLWTYFTF